MNRPMTLVCYICGREFGTKSLAIHIKSCEKKWENEQNLKPPKLRRPCPRPPKGFEDLTTKDTINKKDINNYNLKSYDAFVQQALVQCEYCGRRFNQKSLVPHQKACKTHPMIRKPYVNKGPLGKHSEEQQPISNKGGFNAPKTEDYGDSSQGNLVPCRRCGRKFTSDRVSKHQGVCKGDKFEAKNVMSSEQEKQKKPQINMKPNFATGKKPKWKVQHEQLQNAMKQMRKLKDYEAKGGKLSDLPPPERGNYDHYVQCRYCGRKYAAEVAQRHIPKCANIVNKPGGIKPSKIQEKYIVGTGSGSSKQAVSNSYPIKPTLVTSSKNNFGGNLDPYPSKPSAKHISQPPTQLNQPKYGQVNQQSNSKPLQSPFGKPVPKGVKVTQSYGVVKNVIVKGSTHGKDSANKYW